MFGTESAGVAGKSRYESNTPLSVYLRKTGDLPEFGGNRYTEAGLAFEQPIAALCEKDTGWTLRKANKPRLHPSGYLGAHLDYTVVPRPGSNAREAVDIKYTARGRPGDGDWGEPGSDQIPVDYLFQAHTQIVSAKLDAAHFYAFFGSSCDRQLYTVERSREWEELLVEMSRDFIENHVKPRIPPEWTESEVGLRFPIDNGAEVPLDAMAVALIERWEELGGIVKVSEDERAKLADQIKAMIGEARYGHDGERRRVDFRTVVPKAPDANLTLKALEAEDPEKYRDIIAKYGTPRGSFRALYPVKAKKEKA